MYIGKWNSFQVLVFLNQLFKFFVVILLFKPSARNLMIAQVPVPIQTKKKVNSGFDLSSWIVQNFGFEFLITNKFDNFYCFFQNIISYGKNDILTKLTFFYKHFFSFYFTIIIYLLTKSI